MGVEAKTADKYMAYLASAISGARGDTYPVTDSKVSMATLGGAANGDVDHRLSALRYVAITEAPPVPLVPVKAADLRDFKEKHAKQLQRCRVHLDGQLADVAAIADDHLRQVKAAEVMQQIQDDVAILQEGMNKRKWPKVLAGVGGVAVAGLGIAGTIVTGGAALALGLAVAGGAISAGVAGIRS